MKFITHNTQLSKGKSNKKIDVNGTALLDYVETTFEKLNFAFGKPLLYGDPSKPGWEKSDAEWIIEFSDKKVATIYNYKDGKAYCGEEGKDVKDITEWHIGGHNIDVVQRIINVLKGHYNIENESEWVCQWCGSEDIYEIAYIPMNSFPKNYSEIRFPKGDEYIGECCGDFEYPLTRFEWEEKVAEETMGNKEEYHKILDGSRL